MNKSLQLLAIARKAQRLAVGEEPVGVVCREGHARLVLIAQDAAEHTFRRAQSFCRSGKPAYIRAPFTKQELGAVLGCSVCALCAVTDAALAKAFLESLDAPEQYSAVLAELSRLTERAAKRRREEKAHRKNVKFGKK